MNIKEKIDSDFLTAYKAHDDARVSILRLLKSAIKNDEIKKKGELTEDEVIATLKREAKQRKDAIEEYKKAGKTEMVEKETFEVEIINSYLPAQMSEEEIRKIVADEIAALNIADATGIGRLMGSIMQKHGSSVDGGTVSKIARELLQK